LDKVGTKKKLWRHDDESCTVFHYFSELRKSHCIKNPFNDVCISTLIDAAQIGVLAQLNEELFNIGLLTPSTIKSYYISLLQPNVEGKKKQSMKHMVHVFAPKIGETKLSSKQIKQDDDRNKDNKENIIIHHFILDQRFF
jgi:hypothetical protein